MNTRRLCIEEKAMVERWPALRPLLRYNAAQNRIWWELTLCVAGNTLPIRIIYPAAYPAQPPTIAIGKVLPNRTPHSLWPDELSGGFRRMCWLYPGEDRRNENIWSPGRDTAAMCVGVALRWFHAFLVWITIDVWPVRDALDAT